MTAFYPLPSSGPLYRKALDFGFERALSDVDRAQQQPSFVLASLNDSSFTPGERSETNVGMYRSRLVGSPDESLLLWESGQKHTPANLLERWTANVTLKWAHYVLVFSLEPYG
uniref:PSD1 domain-containing protein n=1 Tax=Ascaris lumbricoides TaxID=6252 RepID=A0A0M3HR52_ASCLU